MILHKRTINKLAEMICGSTGQGHGFDHTNFRYRSSSYLTEFFENIGLDYSHDGSTRKYWVQEVLNELNSDVCQNPLLPSDNICRAITELMDSANFESNENNREKALVQVNELLKRDGLEVSINDRDECVVVSTGTQASSDTLPVARRRYSAIEEKRRELLLNYLGSASEDDIIENILAPMYSQLGWQRISIAGHTDKSLEVGKDLWMKYRLPTGHFIYFGVQAKKGKLDARGKSSNTNVTEILTQVRMMIDHPILDPETNKRILIDHVFIACGGEITKQARQWLGEHLDQQSRRHIIFMDRDDILGVACALSLPIFKELENKKLIADLDDIPF